MKWSVTTPPAARPVTTTLALAHLRLNASECEYVETLIDAATAHAEEVTQSSIITQTITAVFNVDDAARGFANAVADAEILTNVRTPSLKLPRGPVASITSVTGASGVISPSLYTLERIGNADQVRIVAGYNLPLTIVYVAGRSVDAVPASLKVAILTHVAALYENRETIGDKNLEAFYRYRSHGIGIG